MGATETGTAFKGTDRFVVERLIGEGASGSVYRAYDRERGEHVALKVLRVAGDSMPPDLSATFKALAELRHANLCRLHELLLDQDRWLITMQLLEGVDFLFYVRGDRPATALTVEDEEEGPLAMDAPARYDEIRLRSAVQQLAAGLELLHAAGRHHGHLEPRHASIDRDGHLRLLGFGLRSALGAAPPATPEERAAADWYSLGSMLHQAIAGHAPADEPLLPEGTPPDLARLCLALLDRRPDRRPTGPAIRRGLQLCHDPLTLPQHEPAEDRPFLGREKELAAMGEALAATRQGKPVVLHLCSASGVGKTTLIESFLRLLPADAVVLPGRCHQRESIPYKALVRAIAALARHLRRLSSDHVALVLPREVWALARLFPLLEQVPAIAASPRPETEPPDRQELRRRGAAALREMLCRMAARHPLVIVLDDVQWGGPDSAALLSQLAREPDAPAMLLVLSYTRDEADRSPFLRTVLADPVLGAAATRKIELPRLPDEFAVELARALDPAAPPERIADVIRNADGNPLLLRHLSHATVQPAKVSGEQVVHALVDALPTPARRLLEVVAVAGEPIERAVALRAAQLESEGGAGSGESARAAEAALRDAGLLQRYGVQEDWLVVFHNQVRAAVVDRLLPSDRQAHHRQLAAGLQAAGHSDANRLATHLEGAGDANAAAPYLGEAAGRAAGALAFERAAALYRRALAIGASDGEERRNLLRGLAEALVNAGHASAAAEAYMQAAGDADPEQAMDLRRTAAAQLLLSGRAEDALLVLRAGGHALPSTPRRARASRWANRLRLRLRGLSFEERSPRQISGSELRRIDTAWTMGLSLAVSDPVLGAWFESENLLRSLEAGDLGRIARALALEAGYLAAFGVRSRLPVEELLALTKTTAQRSGGPYLGALTALAIGMSSWVKGEWRICFEACEEALHVFSERCAGVAWEQDFASVFGLTALGHLGEWKEIGRRLPTLQQIARDRSDFFLGTWLLARMVPERLLLDDRPGDAMATLKEALSRSPGFTLTPWWTLRARTLGALYEGDGGAAWARVKESWSSLQPLIRRMPVQRIQSLCLRAGAALALAARRQGDATLWGEAERAAAQLQGENAGWARPFAERIRAAVLEQQGQRTAAIERLATAEGQFAEHQMQLQTAATRRQRGRLIGGDQGEARIAAADATMSEQGVKRPDRFADMLAPGFAR